MINFAVHRFAFVFVFVLLVSGFVLWGAEPAMADGGQSKNVTIVSGFETAASNRTRTIVRKRRRGDRLVIDRRFVRLGGNNEFCLLYTSPSPRDRTRSRMPSSA